MALDIAHTEEATELQLADISGKSNVHAIRRHMPPKSSTKPIKPCPNCRREYQLPKSQSDYPAFGSSYVANVEKRTIGQLSASPPLSQTKGRIRLNNQGSKKCTLYRLKQMTQVMKHKVKTHYTLILSITSLTHVT